MKENLTGKITVVTGGARGIGFAIAERLIERGATVAFCSTRQKSVDEAISVLGPKGTVFGAVADVSRLDDVRQFIGDVARTFGRIDVLVNNAAIRTYKAVGELDPTEWDRMLAVNLSGAYYCMHEVVPVMKRGGGGDIVNISSLSSMTPFAGGAGYNASKAGLNGLSGAAMLDYRYDGIRVTEIMPGSTDTEFNGEAARAEWKVSPVDVADAVELVLCMDRRTTISRVDLKPSMPPRKGGV